MRGVDCVHHPQGMVAKPDFPREERALLNGVLHTTPPFFAVRLGA